MANLLGKVACFGCSLDSTRTSPGDEAACTKLLLNALQPTCAEMATKKMQQESDNLATLNMRSSAQTSIVSKENNRKRTRITTFQLGRNGIQVLLAPITSKQISAKASHFKGR